MASTDAINNHLVQELSAKVKQNWLRDCINYFKENEPHFSFNELLEGVKEQLFLANYKDSCDPVIPTTFKNRKDIWMLNQSLFLQMQFLVDICELKFKNNVWARSLTSFTFQLSLFMNSGDNYTRSSWMIRKRSKSLEIFK